jgi:hypothetical protein
MSDMTVKGRWCDVIVLDVHTTAEDESDATRDSFCEELERVLDQFYNNRLVCFVG